MNGENLTEDVMHRLVEDNQSVALHLRQELLPVETGGRIIFPPTYADIGYNIDTLNDGTQVALIDSVGSQANRMEPIFKEMPYRELVPQIRIEINSRDQDGTRFVNSKSIFDLAHRAADSVILSSPGLSKQVDEAFRTLRQTGDAGPLCSIAPTSLVFGVWDSRGGSGEKIPRLVRSVIRAWDVDILHTAAQFNSVWKELDQGQKNDLEKEAKSKRIKLSEKGLADSPAVFRRMSEEAEKGIPEFMYGKPNPNRRVLGGVSVNGKILRDITINLVALRKINTKTNEEGRRIRSYILSLAILAATADLDLYLREGCHLKHGNEEECWQEIRRRGASRGLDFSSTKAQDFLKSYALGLASCLKNKWPRELNYSFQIGEAKKILSNE